MLPAKKARSAARAKKRSLADDHGEQPEPAQQAAFAGGVAPGAAAQLTGLMPVAVVFFTGLALASLWRTPNQCSEGAKSLIQLELCPDELRLAGITQPPTFSSKPGQTPFWREAKDWAKKQWLVEAVGTTLCSRPWPTANWITCTNDSVENGTTHGKKYSM